MKKIIRLCFTLVAIFGVIFGFSHAAYAVSLPELPSHQALLTSPFKFFISSEQDVQDFDSWKIDSGYSYSLFENVDIYVGARMDRNSADNQSGFLSGVSYQISPRFSVKSTLHSYSGNGLEEGKESSISAEVSSRMRLTENLDVHATLDYQEWQQGVEVGLGFRF